ncbi:MAG: marine proteobacterial sortase target protein [Halioglobus sp.]
MRYLALFYWPMPVSLPSRCSTLMLWLYFRCMPVLAVTIMALAIFSPNLAHSTQDVNAQGKSHEPGAGHLMLRTTGSTPVSALATETRVHFDINGLVAVVELEQSFINTSTQWAEGVYSFPLPGTAAVRYMEMIVGERRVVGKVRERSEARKRYEKAKKAGKKASLVEQQRPNLFTSRIANIAPGERVTVKLEYVQSVDYQAGEFSLSFPMTITPRYIPGNVELPDSDAPQTQHIDLVQGWGLPTDQVTDANRITPYLLPPRDEGAAVQNPAVVSASLDMGLPLAEVSSLYHEVRLQRDEERYRVELVGGKTEMDRDFVLHWRPVVGAQPKVALFTEEVDEEHYGLLMVLPPAQSTAQADMPREVIFIVDTSGSMGGVAIDQAKLSVSKALQRLRSEDFFNVIEFNSNHSKLYEKSIRATRHHVLQAQEFVRHLQASGGTEMMPALLEALSTSASQPSDDLAGEERLRQIVFITDGAVGNEAALYSAIASKLGNSRLFTVGIGSAPNSWFMRKAADIGRGTHTHIGTTEEVGQKIDQLLSQLQQPALIDIGVAWQGSVESWPEFVPDLYAQEPVVLAVRFGDAPPSGELEVSGTRAGQQWKQVISLPDPEVAAAGQAGAATHSGVASLWARRKIEGLLDQKVLGAQPDKIKAAVLDVALTHQLLSPYTSFVAIEEVVVRPEASGLQRTAVPNSAPNGQSAQVFAYPQTATTGPARLYLGLLLLFIVLIARVMRREGGDA